MREPVVRWSCLAIGLCGTLASVAQADDFRATVVPAKTKTALGLGANSIGARHPELPVTVLAMPAADSDPGLRKPAESYDLRVARAFQSDPFAPIKRSLRARGTGMHDAYLRGSSGLRASVGSSYHMQYRASDSGPAAAAGTAALMRLPVGAVNLRDGYESYAPVAMAGYDAQVSDRMKIGVEAGMMIGRSTAMYADETLPDVRDAGHVTRNPVADVVMSYAF